MILTNVSLVGACCHLYDMGLTNALVLGWTKEQSLRGIVDFFDFWLAQ